MRRGTWIGIGGLAGVAAVFGARGETVTVPSSRCAIVAPAASNAFALAAAQELQKHLALLSGTNPPLYRAGAEEPGWFPFYVGVPVPDGATNWLPEEAGWRVSSNAVHLDGDLRGHGLRFAVYDFLETQAGIRWLMPGDAGIAYEPQPALTLTLGSFRGQPVLPQRHIRAYARLAPVPRMADGASEEAIRQIEANNAVAQDVMDWQKRMRLGNRGAFNYGHAFTGWWDRYAKTHPDYFALNKHGKREPERPVAPTEAHPEFTAKERANVKVCVSNPNVAEQIVDNWVAAGARGRWINTCETDLGWGFCRCPACTALDVPEPGESAANRSGQFEEHLTDRYVHLANAVMRAARKRGYDVGASLYAYNQSERPPRRLALETNAFVSIVPTTLDLDELEARFSGWARAGAPALHLRPNLTRYFQTVGLPLGIEKQFFDAFQIAYRHGAIGADYDRLMGQWALFGAADYILARAMGDPEKSFAYWMDHYCAAFGPAADDVKAYFRYWREEVWEKRLRPDLNAITERGKWYNFARGLLWSPIDRYYTAADFDRTDAFLAAAAAKPLSASRRALLRQMELANTHGRLTANALAATGPEKFVHAQALREFRERHGGEMAMSLGTVAAIEAKAGDVTGVVAAERLKEYPLPWFPTDLHWRFQLDPDDRGETERWAALSWDAKQKWSMLRTDHFWKSPHEAPPELTARLKGYEGVGWYATRLAIPESLQGRDLYLYFGAVDNSCQVYVNGVLAGAHLFEKGDDWNTPFEIRIDPAVKPDQPLQDVTVRVLNKGGSGGIWRRVWLVSKARGE